MYKLYVCFSPLIFVSLYVSLSLCVNLYLNIFVSLYVSICHSLSLSLYVSIYPSLNFYFCLPHSNSYSQINMLQDDYCNVLCQMDLKSKDVTDFKQAIKRQYHHNWIVDNLPAASILDSDQFVTTQYVGFPVGYLAMDQKSYYLYNHVNIILEYHTVEADGHRIVGFSVEPLSVKHTFTAGAYLLTSICSDYQWICLVCVFDIDEMCLQSEVECSPLSPQWWKVLHIFLNSYYFQTLSKYLVTLYL